MTFIYVILRIAPGTLPTRVAWDKQSSAWCPHSSALTKYLPSMVNNVYTHNWSGHNDWLITCLWLSTNHTNGAGARGVYQRHTGLEEVVPSSVNWVLVIGRQPTWVKHCLT